MVRYDITRHYDILLIIAKLFISTINYGIQGINDVVTEIDIRLNLEFRCGNFWEFWLNLEFRYDLQVTEFRIQSNQNFSYEVYLKLRWLNLEFSQIWISVMRLSEIKVTEFRIPRNYRNWILNSVKISRNYHIWILNPGEHQFQLQQ